MLCTFTKTGGETLVIRSEDIKAIYDYNESTVLLWLIGNDVHSDQIQGTARDNMIRLQQEELEAMARVNAFQQMPRIAPPQPPVPRGKPRLVKP